MTNIELLNEYIEKSGLKLQYIADQLFITRWALYQKLNNKSSFKQGEIKKLCELLNISPQECIKIFLS